MLLHFVVISVFVRDNHRAARLGTKASITGGEHHNHAI
jgi:hypothetical protein